MTSFNVVPFIYTTKNMTGPYNVITQIYEKEYISVMHIAVYPFK